MGKLDKYFFKSLPEYFYLNDSYKDNNNEGILERMLNSFQELDEGYLTDIDGLYNLQKPNLTSSSFLSLISGLFNYPPFPFDYEEWFKKVLTNIIAIKKYRGTEEGVRRYFRLWGITATVTIYIIPIYRYNDIYNYNEYGIFYRGGCNHCVRWSIDLVDDSYPEARIPELTVDPLPDNTRLAIQSILEYLIPINVILTEITYNGVPIDINLYERNLILFESNLLEEGILVQEDDNPLIDSNSDYLTSM